MVLANDYEITYLDQFRNKHTEEVLGWSKKDARETFHQFHYNCTILNIKLTCNRGTSFYDLYGDKNLLEGLFDMEKFKRLIEKDLKERGG